MKNSKPKQFKAEPGSPVWERAADKIARELVKIVPCEKCGAPRHFRCDHKQRAGE